jgi:hypothetical protein
LDDNFVCESCEGEVNQTEFLELSRDFRYAAELYDTFIIHRNCDLGDIPFIVLRETNSLRLIQV